MPIPTREDHQRIRHNPKLVQKIVDELDAEAARSAHATDRRGIARYQYRIQDLMIDIQQNREGWRCYSVPTRNISDTGMSIILGQFVYPKTPVRVRLTNIYNIATSLAGVVTRCRYIPSTPGLYEVGIRFDTKIDFSLFCGGKSPVRVVVVDETLRMQQMIRTLLTDSPLQVTTIVSAANLTEKLLSEAFDLAILHAQMAGLDLVESIRTLRSAGCVEPLVGYSSSENTALMARSHAAGLDVWLPTPVTQNALRTLIETLKKSPVVSSFIYQPEMIPAIDQFANSVRSRARDILKLSLQSDSAELKLSIDRLGAEAEDAGFERLTKACQELTHQLSNAVEPSELRLRINQFVRMCFSVRGATCVELSAAAK